MIRESPPRKDIGQEAPGPLLEPAQIPEHLIAIIDLILTKPTGGFEDIMSEPLGTGRFDNTPRATSQLACALSIVSHPTITKVLGEKTASNSRDAINKFREHQVLSGIRVIDLGCGNAASFAIVAHALGAEAYTADVTDLETAIRERIDGHIVVDLGLENASTVLKEATGGNFDLVTENIISQMPGSNVRAHSVDPGNIILIAKSLLKMGGYLDSAKVQRQQERSWPYLLRRTR